MRFERLPEKKSDEEINLVRITNPKVAGELEIDEDKDSPTFGQPKNVDEAGNVKPGHTFVIPAPQFEYPQYDTVAEFFDDCGGEDKALSILNGMKRDAALDAGKQKIRTTVTGSKQDIIAAGLKAVKEHNFLVTESISAKEAKDLLTSLGGRIKDMDPKDIQAELAKALGISL